MIPSVLLTDLYQLTMANGYFKLGLHNKQACFQQFFRRNPFGGGYTIAAGLEDLLCFLSDFAFKEEELSYLSSLKSIANTALFEKDFIEFLRNFRLTCDIDAVMEGTALFPQEPMLRVRGPIIQCQILETIFLNILNFQSLIATKSSRCVQAAQGREVVDFGLRRAQGPDGGISATRAAYIGGCTGTSNVFAGKLFGIPVKGTQAHSWIMAFENEKRAFREFARVYPDQAFLLVDTYHTVRGIENAIEIGEELKRSGHKLLGVRLDSGNFMELSIKARNMLDTAGLLDAKIMVSGDLDEYKIAELVQGGAPIDIFGVGTRLVTAFDEPALGGVYKLAEIEGDAGQQIPKLKISEDLEKSTLPGSLQVRRYRKNGQIVRDVLFQELEDPSLVNSIGSEDLEASNLLVNVFKRGKRIKPAESLLTLQKRARKELSSLSGAILRLKNPSTFEVSIDKRLLTKQKQLMTNRYQ